MLSASPVFARTVVLALFMVGCGGGESTPEQPPAEPVPAEPAAPATPDMPELTAESLKAERENIALVPSPVETQRALEEAGIDTVLADLIPKHEFDVEKSDIDHAAIRTGVVLADALLTVKTAEEADLIARLDTIQKGMNQLNGGSDIDATIKDMKDRFEADAVNRDELLKEFDELSGAVIPELEFNGNDRVVPLIQAGSWLEGAHLVAKAMKKAEDAGPADTLLKQPEVVDYFLTYVKTEGSEKAPEAVTAKLEESLSTLKGLASKSDALDGKDIQQTIKVTRDVLGLL